MTFLPIVDRELRAAARRRGTFRLRSLVVLISLIMTFGALVFLAAGAGPRNVGEPLFTVLTGCAFLLCPLMGVTLTADSLSEEKREGTLGLLFLTDLKGYDVVLGKFAASSLNAFYGLFSLLPILALPLLLGGVTGGQFLRVSLALLNALFFCLAAGVLVSSLTRESRAALGGTFWLLLLATVVLPAMRRVGEVFHVSPAWLSLTGISPFYPFSWAADVLYRNHAAEYWGTLAASHLTGWFFLGLASFTLPRTWRETGNVGARRRRVHPLEIGGAANPLVRKKRDAEALSVNPVLWVIGRHPGFRVSVWIIVCVWGAAATATGWLWSREPQAAYYFGKVCAFLFKMLVAVQACRFFAESRRDGMLEMMLYTPLRTADILRGQWLVLSRMFLMPLFVFLFFNLVPIAFAVWSAFSANGFPEGRKALLAIGTGGGAFLFTVTFVADIFAVCWFGMWLALTLKKPALAPLFTILFVLVVPSFFCFFDLAADFVFIVWGASRLQQDFRYRFGRQYESVAAAPMPRATFISSPAPPLIKPR